MGIEKELFTFSRYVDGSGNLHRASRLNIAGATATYNATTDTLTLSGLGGGGSNTLLGLSDTPDTYAGQALRLVRVNAGATAVEFATNSFLNLTDSPDSYAAQGSKFVRVNPGGTALEFTTALTTFLGLTDTPDTYSAQALKLPRVNAGATALEFVTDDFLRLVDVPDTYVGQALKLVRVNAGATALEFATVVEASAIHTDVAAEIAGVTAGTQIEFADSILGESAGASPVNSKRKFTGSQLGNTDPLGITSGSGDIPSDVWVGDDIEGALLTTPTTVKMRRASGTWAATGNPPVSANWVNGLPVAGLLTGQRYTTTDPVLLDPHEGAPNATLISMAFAIRLRADGAGLERTLWCAQNEANDGISRKLIYINAAGYFVYESLDSTGTPRDSAISYLPLPLETEMILFVSLTTGGQIRLSYSTTEIEVDSLGVSVTLSSSGVIGPLTRISIGARTVGGVAALPLKGYIRAWVMWNNRGYGVTSSLRILRQIKSFAPVTSGYPETWELDPRSYGAFCDGVTDDRAAVMTAINVLGLAGGGVLRFPPGTTLVGDDGAGNAILIDNKSNIRLCGAGRGRTVIKLKAGSDSGTINIQNSTNIAVSDLTIDGNRLNVSTVLHGIRSFGDVSGLTIEHVEIASARGYGIGLQGNQKKRVYINDVWVHDTGSDGIDVKNNDDNNEQCFMSNVVVWDYGKDLALGLLSPQAGVDVRGPWQLNNIWVSKPSNTGAGVRLREGDVGGPSGFGGHRSHLTNFHVVGSDGSVELGVEINVDDAVVSNGYIRDCFRGVSVIGKRAVVSGVTVASCAAAGFLAAADTTPPFGAAHTVFSNCRAIGNGGDGFAIKNDWCKVTNCLAESNEGNGVAIDAAKLETVLEGNTFLTNLAPVSDAGTNTHASKNTGWATKVNLLSAPLACDSTGSRTAVLTHGLGIAMSAAPVHCQATVVMESAVNDYAVKLLRVESITSTQVTVRGIVSEASATAAATFRIAVMIDTRP